MVRPKVLHVIPSLAMAHGGPTLAMQMMETALSNDADVTTLTTDDDGPGRRFAVGDRPASTAGAERVYIRRWLEFYKIAPGLVPWLWGRVGGFDVVHIHALFSFTSAAAAMIARARGVPYIVRPLGTLAAYGIHHRRRALKRLSFWTIEGPILRHAAAVHFTSESEREEAAKLGVAMRGVVIPLGVAELETDFVTRSGPAADRAPAILYLSRLDPKKNLEGLLRAVVLLDGPWGGARLAVAGAGAAEYEGTLHTLAETLGIAHRVDWLGHIEGSHKAAVFAKADVFVLPSWSENFGIAAVEAMLIGLPCVLSRGVAIADQAGPAGAVTVVEPKPEAIAGALRTLLNDPVSANGLGLRGQAFARKTYSTKVMGNRLIELYQNIKAGQLPERTCL